MKLSPWSRASFSGVDALFSPNRRRTSGFLVAALLLAACGGDSAGGGGSTGGGVAPPPPAPIVLLSDSESARFLTQATFGAREADIATLSPLGFANWTTQQQAMAPTASHQTQMDNRLAALRVTTPTASLSANNFYETFWQQAVTGNDQLRQRVKLAYSEIFVISLNDANVDVRGAGSYYDMLGVNAFGNFRQLLENVTLHPMMGIYLTSLGNQKEDPATGRHPDENYAREVMQLMTIGLTQLNIDGTNRLDGAGNPIPTYTDADIQGLAKVFTGMSWYHPTPTNSTFRGGSRDPDSTIRPMILYSNYHSTSQKDFLGVSIPANATPNPAGDLTVALDTLFNHPNVGPFIGKRLIQHLVTSNPSPAYVTRVATVFNNNGSGVRGDMAAVIRAILTDPEARNDTVANSSFTFGKIREPIVRMANWMRAFGATSTSGFYTVNSTSAATSLNQSALTSPSVFNFWRPGYVPPNTRLGAQNLAAPELQVVDEVTIAGYLNTMQTTINSGIGSSSDVRSTYAAEIALASDPAALTQRMNKLLLYGNMSAVLRSRIEAAVTGVTIPGGTATQAQIDAALLNRAKLAVFLTMASPEYLVQR